ncbi:hypothetical protein IAU60_001385 [Kwoniella sp. DSM 27419]
MSSPHQIGSLPFENPGYPQASRHASSPSQAYHSRFQSSGVTGLQGPFDYFTNAPSSSYSTEPIVNLNVDDIAYRYSGEFNRAPGTPTVGIYARDGLWDDEEEEQSQPSQSKRGTESSTTASSSRKTSIAASSSRVRSRSNTVSATVSSAEDKSRGAWTWRRPSMVQSQSPMLAADVEMPLKKVEKKKSRGLLRGKGRKGELSVKVDPDESFEAPPPLPTTPASFMTGSPVSFTSSAFSPVSYPSPNLDTPPTLTPVSAMAPIPAAKQSKAASSWKRGMQKIFRSKSSAALRDAADKENHPEPPIPDLPLNATHKLGKPFAGSTPPGSLPSSSSRSFGKSFSASTPPLGDSRRANATSPLIATPRSDSFVPQSIPHDPFASSLNLSANQSRQISAAPPKSRPSLRYNSPSLRDLKSLLPINTKPKLSKAKSLANLQEGPKSAPLERTDYFPPSGSKFAKRMSSLVGLNIFATSPESAKLEVPPTKAELAPPIESPPLLPPHPPFAGPSRSPSLPTIASDSASSSSPSSPSEDSLSASIPPSAPLPPLPSPSSPSLTTPIQRSASGAVLLPRSRSTSMSLKSPPTSSSFFDLYEQLGIWPNAEKIKEDDAEAEAEVGATADKPIIINAETDKENVPAPTTGVPTEATLTSDGPDDAAVVASETLSSSASWSLALNSFPDAPVNDVMDFGLPYVSDEAVGPTTSAGLIQPAGDNSDALSIMAVAASSRHSQNTTMDISAETGGARNDNRASGSTVTHVTSAGTEWLRSTSSMRGRRSGGSGGSSREGSPERRRVSQPDPEDEADETSDEDDVPLAKLHPDAAAAQAERRQARRAARAARRAAAEQPSVTDKRRSAKAYGRNPGGDSGWDGEGGVPADILTRKLEAAIKKAASLPATSAELNIPQGLYAHRSMRDAPPSLEGLKRAQSQGQARGQPSSSPVHWAPPVFPPHASPVEPTFRRVPGDASYSSERSRQSSGSSRVSHTPRADAGVTRSNTSASRTSRQQRPRAHSNAAPASSSREESATLHARSTTEPIPGVTASVPPPPPPSASRGVHVPAFVTTLNAKPIMLDIHPATTARDVLVSTHRDKQLSDASAGMSWVLCEVFAELGYERQVREYEPLLPIVKGWESAVRHNCFVFRQSNGGVATWVRAVPTSAPMIGSWVQYESKKGKWSKRWLETRGGQVFLAKNEKNKDEVHLNILFFDIYSMTRVYDSPKPCTFAMKRVEPASTFEDRFDYTHVFSCEESQGFKLMSAIYDAKSYTLAQVHPGLFSSRPVHGANSTSVSRRPTAHGHGHGYGLAGHAQAQPLVTLPSGDDESKSGFTGKGLLRI